MTEIRNPVVVEMSAALSLSSEKYLPLEERRVSEKDCETAKRRKEHHMLCAVCGDRAESKHYGAYACNGCKGFFRRSVWNSRVYYCRRTNQCSIVKEIRNVCKACRFQRCLKVGMNPKELQGSRKPTTFQSSKLPSGSEEEVGHMMIELCQPKSQSTVLISNPCFDRSQPDALLMLDRHILQRTDHSLTIANENLCGSIDVPFVTAFRQPSLVSRRTEISDSYDRIATVNDLNTDFQRKFVLFADWLNKFYDFQMLPEYVQLILAKTHCSTYCWAINAWRTQRTGCPGISFTNGSYFPSDSALQCLPDDKDITSLFIQDLVGSMKALEVDEVEYVLLKVISLFTEDSYELSDSEKKLVRNYRDKYLDILAKYVQSRYPHLTEQAAACRVGQLVLLLASLTHIVYLSNDNITYVDTLKIANLGELTREVHRNEMS